MRKYLVAVIGLASLALAAACGGSSSSSTPTAKPASTSASTPAATAVSGSITVFAASSLTDAFNQAATAFKAANPGVKVTFNFGGSPTLVTQLDQGANADVLATADQPNMKNAQDKGLIREPTETFARNRLAIIVPKSNPGKITTPADLAKSGLKLVLAEKTVPVGSYARQSLAKFNGKESYPADFDAQVLKNVVSDESNVKSVVTKVQLGEADAGIVYVTDVTPGVAGDITQIAIPDAYNVIASYPIAVTKDASNRAAAQAFIDFLLSDAGQSILEKDGFMRAQ